MSKCTYHIFAELNRVDHPRAAIPAFQILNDNYNDSLKLRFAGNRSRNDGFNCAGLTFAPRRRAIGELSIDNFHGEHFFGCT
jgi:hypothetical protein